MRRMAENLLEVRNMSKTFGGFVANDDLSIDVPRGGIVGLIGPNGSGKTTVINSIVGSHPIDRGSVRFDGREISGLKAPQIARLGLLRTFQYPRVYEQMTCLQNIEVSAPRNASRRGFMWGRPPDEEEQRAREILSFVGLNAISHLQAGSLSFGQRKLLEFAMALTNEPRILLLDEPAAGIDPRMVHEVIERIQSARVSRHVSFLIVEHDLRVIAELADQVYCLVGGRVCATGTPDEIRADKRVLEVYLGSSPGRNLHLKRPGQDA
jgi:ABC-type branched-subunit amino acid transport system ATPase component